MKLGNKELRLSEIDFFTNIEISFQVLFWLRNQPPLRCAPFLRPWEGFQTLRCGQDVKPQVQTVPEHLNLSLCICVDFLD